ncbi:MAG TPA: hypothetical protein VLL73_05890 [Desulfurivibrionaceae bacterium]|nr:hypothetical protein [Desulfurivibrionaceae bacterium]
MRINDASAVLASSHSYREEHIEEESLRLWVGNQRPDFEGNGQPTPNAIPAAVIVALSDEARSRAQQELVAPLPALETSAPPTAIEQDPKLQAIRLILEALTGKKIRVAEFTPSETAAPTAPPAPDADNTAPPRQVWGLEYDYHEVYREVETVEFSASGEIRTADGQTVQFRLDMAMRREFVQETFVSVRAGDALLVDPLVINFGGQAAQLSDQRFRFDLDLDGRAEDLPMPAAGSGFLALDRNNDGIINNGGELFGPATGNGFGELRGLDSDGNGWLDENDPLFAKLRIWMRDAAGSDFLYSLKEKHIGALLLDAAATPFSLTDSANALQGKLRETSIYLTEAGQAGTVQELDIAV